MDYSSVKHPHRRGLFLLMFLSISGGSILPANAAVSERSQQWQKIEIAFDSFFKRVPQHQAYSVITQEEVEPLWADLAKAGWAVPQAARDELTNLIPKPKEFMIRNLQTPTGRRFMRQVAQKYPEVYDRLDMLAHTDGGGRPGVQGLIAAPDAELTVRYMFTKEGERSWASMLPQRYKFDRPTGRIYTAESLKTRLKQIFEPSN